LLLEGALHAERRLRSAWERFETAYADAWRNEGERLLSTMEIPELLRGLALGSASVVASLRQRRRDPSRVSRKERRLEEALARYACRAALKPSPFSTLTRAALAETRDVEEWLVLRGHGWRQRSLVRVPRSHLEACLALLKGYFPFRERLPVTINEAREESAPDRYRLLRPGFWEPDPQERSGRYVQPAIVEIDVRPPLASWLGAHLSGKDLIYRDLVQRLERELDPEFRKTVDRLLDLGFLVYRFPWNSDDPHLEARFLEHVRSMPEVPGMEDLAEILAEILLLENGFSVSRRPEADLARCQELNLSLWNRAARLAGMDPPPEPPPGERSALYEDVFLVAEGKEVVAQVGYEPMRGLLRTLDPLAKLAAVYDPFYDFLASLGALCAEKLPGATEISWLELLRVAFPLWQEFARFERVAERARLTRAATFNPFHLAALSEWQAAREKLSRELLSCVETHDDASSGVVVASRLLALLASLPERAELPRTACFFLQPVGPYCEQWVLNRAYEGGRHHSRYMAVMDEEMRAAVTAHYRGRSIFEHGEETWEILDVLYPAGKAINVHEPQTPRVLEMPGERSCEPASHRLGLRDLRVVLPRAGGLPFLTDREGRRVLPLHAGPILLRDMPLPLKLLRVFGVGSVDLVLPEIRPVSLGEVKLLPRLSIGNVVLRRRSWASATQDLCRQVEGLSPARAFAAVDRWRRARGVPDQVFLARPAGVRTIRDKPLFIDFSSPIFVELFRRRLAAHEQLTMEEVLPSIEEGVPDEAGVRWAVELQLDSLVFPS
jgi:Lantibiotic dehydratase, N terminus